MIDPPPERTEHIIYNLTKEAWEYKPKPLFFIERG